MKKIYESKNYFDNVSLEDIINNLPDGIDISQVTAIPVYLISGDHDINMMIGFKFVVYEEN
jgi:hypothetical protein